MKIAILASEAAPYCRTGGLADVMEALPSALAKMKGNQVLLILPYYKHIKENPHYPVEDLGNFEVGVGWRQAYAGILRLKDAPEGVEVWFVDSDYYFGARSGNLYGHIDDGERFAFFSKACLDAMVIHHRIPDIIQCNNWQTALVPTYLKAMYAYQFPTTRCMFTIHNIEQQGWARADFFDDVLYLPWQWRGCLDLNGSVNLMKSAIETADLITTVSETYARELSYPYYACGLDKVIASASWKLYGITNGIDVKLYNPATDPALAANYDKRSFRKGKAACKAALQQQVGLPVKPNTPLCVMVTRLTEQKGLDLLCYIARRLLWEEDVQLVIMGAGEPYFEEFFRNLAQEFPHKVAVKFGFDAQLESRIYAGGDLYLMPSKSEPCGLNQMNAMRYGTVPVVHATGGLRDTVRPADEHAERGLGFTFQSYNGDDFYAALGRALYLYRQAPESFHALQRRGMEQDFSWSKPAKRYMELFQQMLEDW